MGKLVWQSDDREVMVWIDGGFHIKAITKLHGDPVELNEDEALELGKALVAAAIGEKAG